MEFPSEEHAQNAPSCVAQQPELAAFATGLFQHQPAAGAAVSLQGHGGAISVADVLGLLSSLSRSGLLWVTGPDERFLLQLEHGAVVFAQSDRPPVGSRLGEVLVRTGALSPEQSAQAVSSARAEELPLGTWLLRRALVTPADLSSALALQVQQIFNRMFALQAPAFQFEDGRRLAHGDEVRLNVVQLLLESARTSDEGLRPLDVPVPLAVAEG